MHYLRRVERVFLVTLFLSMVALFSVNVLAREIGGTFASQLAWVEEAVRLMNIFLVFGALGLALERGKHVGIDTLREALPNTARATIRRIIDAAGCVFSLYMAYLAWKLVVFVLSTGQKSPTLDIQIGWIYTAPVIGFGLLALRYALSFFRVIDRFTKNDDDMSDAQPAPEAR
ncbi:MAG: TRAP transporter small permease [Alphaproteobacteria bacterium]